MIKKIGLSVVFILFASVSVASFAADNEWLFGNWLLTYDPDGDIQDRLTFQRGGQFITTEVSSGRQIEGIYTLTQGAVEVTLIQQGKMLLKFDLTYDQGRDKLYYRSNSTGKTSYYTKVE